MLKAFDSLRKYSNFTPQFNAYSTRAGFKLKQLAFNSFKPKRLRKQKNAGTTQSFSLPKPVELKNLNLPKLRETFDRAIWSSEIFKTTQLLETHIESTKQSHSPAMYPIDSKFKPQPGKGMSIIEERRERIRRESLSAMSPDLVSLVEKLRPKSDQVTQSSVSAAELAEAEKLTMLEKRTDEFNQKIYAYVNICLNGALKQEALQLVRRLSKQPEEGKRNLKWMHLNDIEIYNLILLDAAKRGNLKQCLEFYALFRQNANLKPNVHSIAASLLTIGKFSSGHEAKLSLKIHQILNDAEKFGIDVKQIFCPNVSYTSEEMNLIEKTIQISRPGFHVEVDDGQLHPVAQTLLNDLNTKKSTVGVTGRRLNDLDMSAETLVENIRQQFAFETESTIKVPSIFQTKSPNEKSIADRARKVVHKFLTQLRLGHQTLVQSLNQSTELDDQIMFAFLKAIPEEKCVRLMLHEIESLCQGSLHFTPNLKFLCKSLGQKYELLFKRDIQWENVEKLKDVFKKYNEELMAPECNLAKENHRQKFQRLLSESQVNLKSFANKWSNEVHCRIGSVLYNIILENLSVKESEVKGKPQSGQMSRDRTIRLQKVYRPDGIYKQQQILVDPLLSKLFISSAKELSFEANLLPMITPPVPWISTEIGGYLLNSSNLLRLERTHSEQYDLINNEANKAHMHPIYDSLNALSSCPWKINTSILDLMIAIFNDYGNEKLNIPLHESKLPKRMKFEENLPRREYLEMKKKIYKLKKQKDETFSLWCTELYRLSIANKYRDKVIYFPHSLDFRGRTYPIPPHFSHLGSDVARSLIVFAEGRPLGQRGLDMLKVHLVNLTGLKKKDTIDQRLEYANSILDEIIDSAEMPLDGNLWWQQSEEPWQTLACCMEIRNAVKSPNPAEYISHYPIHQDGSCNGLQHYAALGRDEKGANSVNLNDSKQPCDVYSDVAALVEKRRLLHARVEETEDEQLKKKAEIARILKGHVNRKVIKQTVMTTVYNVTRYGARMQILRQLEDKKDFPAEFAKEASAYLTEQTFDSIHEVFMAASKIQDWFCECANLITKLRAVSVSWVTPLGLPVIQPYYRKKRQSDFGYKKMDDEAFDEKQPNSKKNQNAFPPNFIHSLDSTHMMLTSLYCQKENIRFVSVHDCFWTHARDTDDMNRICREQFISLHSIELLENLAKYFSHNFKFTESEIKAELSQGRRHEMTRLNQILSQVPQKGSFDLNKVLKSVYFFS